MGFIFKNKLWTEVWKPGCLGQIREHKSTQQAVDEEAPWDFPGPVAKTRVPKAGGWVQSPVRELDPARAQSRPTLQPHGPQPARLLCPWDSPGKRTGAGCHFLLQEIRPGRTNK